MRNHINLLLNHFGHSGSLGAVYDQDAAMLLTLTVLLMMAAHTLLNRNKHMILQTARAGGIILLSLVLAAGTAWIGDCILRHTACSAAIVRAVTGLAALAATALTAYLAVGRTALTYRDLNRAFAYLHGLLAAAVTVALPGASHIFTISGLMFMVIQLVITFRREAMDWGLELLAVGLYMPVIMPVLACAPVPVAGLLFALSIFPAGIFLASMYSRILPRHRRSPMATG